MKQTICALSLVIMGQLAMAEDTALLIPMHEISSKGVAAAVGNITATENQYGVLFTPHLSGLKAGVHGFHVHEKPSCDSAEKEGKAVAGLAAGGHYDPAATGKHEGPYSMTGHLGDLPALFVTADGKSDTPVLAPRLKLSDLKGRSLMVHAGGDNHSDHPAPLGGGGARVACGIIPDAK